MNGATFAGKARVPKQLLHTVEDSKTLPVRYLPGNPALNHPAAWKGSMPSDRKTFLIFFGILALFGVGLLVSLFGERRLLAKGTPVLAMITSCQPASNGVGFVVKYAFSAGGRPLREGNGWLEKRQEVGAKTWVLYLPQKPRQNHTYPMLNVRLDLP